VVVVCVGGRDTTVTHLEAELRCVRVGLRWWWWCVWGGAGASGRASQGRRRGNKGAQS
jgi:hypothetical protein